MTGAFDWLTTGANWSGAGGVWRRLVEHLWYTLLALAIALVIAHARSAPPSGTPASSPVWCPGLANALRALPTLGLLILLALWGLHSLKGNIALLGPAIAVLVILAVPPILSNTYAGIANVDPAARDAAKGMGMTGREVLTKVELPVAMPLIMSGIRSAFLQVVATATIAAVISLGGFGRYVHRRPGAAELLDDGRRRDPGRPAGHHRRPDPGAHRAFRGVARPDRAKVRAKATTADMVVLKAPTNSADRMIADPRRFRCCGHPATTAPDPPTHLADPRT